MEKDLKKFKKSKMRVAALISGGKDSLLALHKIAKKHEIVCLVSAFPENPHSYMFHTPNLHMLDAISTCLELPLLKIPTKGIKEKEVNDLERGLRALNIDGIVIGGIESRYQKSRFEKICNTLGVELIAPLWEKNPEDLVKEVVEKFEVIFVKVSAMGLDERWLGRKFDFNALNDLKKLYNRYRIHLAGEGGEFETLVLNAPLYKKKIEIEEAKPHWFGDWGVYEIKKFKLTEKF